MSKSKWYDLRGRFLDEPGGSFRVLVTADNLTGAINETIALFTIGIEVEKVEVL